MKLLKSITFGLVAAATVSTASAATAGPTIVHVVGSTAFRNGASVAIIDTLSGVSPSNGTTATKTVYGCYSNSSLIGGAEQVFADGYLGSVDPNPGHDVAASNVVVTSWTGSLAGVVDLTVGVSQVPFLDITNSAVINAVNASIINTSGYTTVAAANLGLSPSSTTGTFALGSTDQTSTNDAVQLAMSDSFQATVSAELATGTLTGTLGTSTSPNGAFTGAPGLAALSADIADTTKVIPAGTSSFAGAQDAVGVVPFVWAAGNTTGVSGYVAPTNMTQQTANALLAVGGVPQSLFSGANNAADTKDWFYLIGRNEDSGTRIGALSESQYGVTNGPVQFELNGSAASPSGSITTAAKFPVTALATESQIKWNTAGHSGYAAGGNVEACLALANTGSGISFTNGRLGPTTQLAFFIGYVGITDAEKVPTPATQIMSYNGAAYSPAAVENGSYSFWTYEHAYTLPTVSGQQQVIVNNIADNIFATDGDVIANSSNVVIGNNGTSSSFSAFSTGSGAGILLGNMQVNRSQEGAAISHN